MDLCWSYEKYFPNRYRLVLIDKVMGRGHTLRAVWVPGYESRRLIDILQAAWYLNSGGKIRNGLVDHTMLILDQIAEKSLNAGKEKYSKIRAVDAGSL